MFTHVCTCSHGYGAAPLQPVNKVTQYLTGFPATVYQIIISTCLWVAVVDSHARLMNGSLAAISRQVVMG